MGGPKRILEGRNKWGEGLSSGTSKGQFWARWVGASPPQLKALLVASLPANSSSVSPWSTLPRKILDLSLFFLINNNKQLSTSTTTPDSHRRFYLDSKRSKYLIAGVWRSAELIRRLWCVWRNFELTFLPHIHNFITTTTNTTVRCALPFPQAPDSGLLYRIRIADSYVRCNFAALPQRVIGRGPVHIYTMLAPPTFTLFTNLPTELQIKIWGFALPGPRIIQCHHSKGSVSFNGARPPTALHVCQLSRKIALSVFLMYRNGLD